MRYSHYPLFLFACISLTVIFNSCKKEPCLTCPPPPIDTTSHNFTWTLQTLGDGASSILYDVAIINDTLAYAVGEINFKDSLGNWQYPPYNVAKWNGQEWRFETTTDSGYGYGALYCVYSFRSDDIWTGSSIPEHWDGKKWTFHGSARGYQGGFWIRKMWGMNSSDLYITGDGGNIYHYNGTNWQKIESGTTLSIDDIWGAYNSTTRQWEILAAAGDPGSSYDRKILQIKGLSASTISDSPIAWPLSGVWFVPNQHYYVVGSGIYEKGKLSDNAWLNNPLDITTYYTGAIRGNAINDVFVGGAYGELLHYNGKSWHSYKSVTGMSNGAYGSVAVRNNLVIAVGEDSPRATVAIGRR